MPLTSPSMGRERWWMTSVVVAALVAGACSGGDDDGGGGLSLEGLRGAGDECPVDLAGSELAADDIGPVEVEVTEGTGEGELDDTALDQAGGVYVECRTAGDDTVAVVYASEQPEAVSLLLPLVQRDLGLAADDLEVILAAYDDAGDGDLVELGAEGPVAVGRLDVDGAESAVLYLSAVSATSREVQDAAETMLDQL
jgi:hypothetical protein